MSASKSTYLRQAIYNAIWRNTAFTGPATVYMSLHTGAPGLVGSNEVAGNAYARTAVVPGGADESAEQGAATPTIAFSRR